MNLRKQNSNRKAKEMTNRKSPFDFETENGFMVKLLYDGTPEVNTTDSGRIMVTNPFSKETVQLPRDAVAVYNVVMGSQLMMELTPDLPERDAELSQYINDGREWFIEHFPKEYMILLD